MRTAATPTRSRWGVIGWSLVDDIGTARVHRAGGGIGIGIGIGVGVGVVLCIDDRLGRSATAIGTRTAGAACVAHAPVHVSISLSGPLNGGGIPLDSDLTRLRILGDFIPSWRTHIWDSESSAVPENESPL